MLAEILELLRLATKIQLDYMINVENNDLSKAVHNQIKLVNEKIAEHYDTDFHYADSINYLSRAVTLQNGFLLGIASQLDDHSERNLNAIIDEVMQLQSAVAKELNLIELTPYKEEN